MALQPHIFNENKDNQADLQVLGNETIIETEKVVYDAINDDRNFALGLENERHQDTINKINALYDKMEGMEKERLVALNEAKRNAKADIKEIKDSLLLRFETIDDEVKGVAETFKEKKDEAIKMLNKME